MADEQTRGKRLFREFSALALIFIGLFLALSVFTFDPGDPRLNQAVSPARATQNQAGKVGAYAAGTLVEVFGVGAYAVPFFFVLAGLSRFSKRFRPVWWRWTGLVLLLICTLGWFAAKWPVHNSPIGDIPPGGLLGGAVYGLARALLKTRGAFLLWLFALLVSLQLTLGLSWAGLGEKLKLPFRFLWSRFAGREPGAKKVKASGKKKTRQPEPEDDFSEVFSPRPGSTGRSSKPSSKSSAPAVAAKPGQAAPPPLDLLAQAPRKQGQAAPEQLGFMSERLEDTLKDFGIMGEVQKAIPGPVVTMFEYKPAPGVKIARIAGLSNDLALALKAGAVRVIAPLPGRDTVGVEIPNQARQDVYLREVLQSPAFRDSASKLTMALGQDIFGRPKTADLARMPHLLVAGATGAGKSVCLNCILMSLLYKTSPEELKLLLVDPKRIELAVYEKLPHLVHPVVTEMNMAKSALDWAVHEMEQRYEAMASLSVRNIDAYNRKVAEMNRRASGDLEKQDLMPYLVIVIDELADLMFTAAKEVEVSIVRLAQLARAAGIHLILATQRPSVDVVTGLIKANFPSRISFQVTSKHDSRTILDTVGAEHLLGRGDMLYKPGSGKIERLHGAFVSDEEIAAVVDYWSSRQAQQFDLDFAEWQKEQKAEAEANGDTDVLDDPKYEEAVDFVMEQGKASISLIQRRFRIGFNRAARFIEQMERQGIIGPADGSKPRQVLKG